MELTLNRFLKMLFDKLWLIVLVTIIFGLTAFSISSFVIKPEYKSETSFLITKLTQEGLSDLNYAKAKKADYIAYTKSEDFLKKIADNLNLNPDYKSTKALTAEELKGYLTITSDNTSSSEYNITVTTGNSTTAYLICKEIADKGPMIYKGLSSFSGEVMVINTPKEIFKAVSPNVALNTIIGLFLGIIVAALLIITIETLDNSIKDENDLIDNYEIPLLGVVYTHKINDVNTGV